MLRRSGRRTEIRVSNGAISAPPSPSEAVPEEKLPAETFVLEPRRAAASLAELAAQRRIAA
jgi:hypothetical protein